MAKNKKKNQMKSEMLEETIQLFINRPHSINTEQIAKETGLGKAWLDCLVMNHKKGKHQSIIRIETLRNYLLAKRG